MWKERATYWECVSEQGTKGWLDARLWRVTGSMARAARGLCRYKTREQAAHEMEHGSKPMEGIALMRTKYGSETEAEARDFYMKRMGVSVVERSLTVPKWNMYIGASTDGDIEGSNGCI